MIKKTLTIRKLPTVTSSIVGSHLLEKLHTIDEVARQNYSSFLLVMDRTVADLYGKSIRNSLRKTGKNVTVSLINDGEKMKSIKKLSSTVQPFFEEGFNRHALLVGVGGGVVTDITGFLGSILLRGIDTCFIPTTLLSQIDASIGGKNGINFCLKNGLTLKNMIGTFYQPKLIITDVEVLKSLPKREIKSGLGEMMKYSIGWKKLSFESLLQMKNLQHVPPVSLIEIISLCQEMKISIVAKDPFELNGLRDSLNLGHTIGHAIEGVAHGRISHGEAVAVGLAGIAKISEKMSILNPGKAHFIIDTIQKLGLPTTVKGINSDDVLTAMKLDKKGGTFVLIEDIGKIRSRQNVPPSILKDSVEELIV